MDERLVDVGGARLHVQAEGDGIPVLVPTGGGTAFYRNTLSRELAARLRLIYVEARGTGASSGTVDGLTFASMADDLDRVRAALGLERVAVLGHSNHGCIALEYALRYPLTAAGVISAGSAPDFRQAFELGQARWGREAMADQKAGLAKLQDAFAAVDPSSVSPDELMYRRYLSLAPLGWRKPDFDQERLWEGAPAGMAAYFSWLFAFGAGWNLVPKLSEIYVPVLAVSGQFDYLCPAELWESAIGALDDGELVVLDESAHNPQYEQPAAFDAAVLRFVERAWG